MEEESTVDREPPSFTIGVDSINDHLNVEQALINISKHRHQLKRSIFDEDLFAEQYNKCVSNINLKNIEINPNTSKYTINKCSVYITPENCEQLVSVLGHIFPHSYTIFNIDNTYYILIPYTWNFFIVCNPNSSIVLVGGVNAVIKYFNMNYPNKLVLISHLG